MNKIWTIVSIASIAILLWIDPGNIVAHMNNAAAGTVSLMIRLLPLYAVWMGMMGIAERSGLTEKLARLLRPSIKFLFGEVDERTSRFLSINMSANILGIGSAATPAGISAIACMDKGGEVATDAMIMLTVLNSVGMQLIPSATIISLRQAFDSAAPFDIIIPTLIATVIPLIFSVAAVKILQAKVKR
ncbi:MAG: hypothetical protein GX304_06500 [Clostridiales bacterium]|mgnify:CR=1 FL=1|jgi:spore maturation protein A|nr:hypothetical protein [Clostridiales bacterium]